MRKGRFSEEQMVAIIREADRDPVAAVAKRHGISEQTIYTWRKRFGGLQASDVKRLRQLEVENGRLNGPIDRKARKDNEEKQRCTVKGAKEDDPTVDRRRCCCQCETASQQWGNLSQGMQRVCLRCAWN